MKRLTLSSRRLAASWILLAAMFGAHMLNAAPPAAHAQSAAPRKQVLFINSYHPGYKFSDDILRGIESVLRPEGDVDLRIEYMDTKRTTNEQYLLGLRDIYRIKYANVKLDLVMVSDDAGLNFLLQYADVMFPNIPIVFCGANYFDARRLVDQKHVTGVSEEADLKGTLDIALKLHPKTKQIVVVNDTSVTGIQIRQSLAQLVPQYPQIAFSWLEDVTMDEARQRVSQLPADSLVLLTIFFRDKAGGFYEYDTFSTLLAQASSAPVYAAWDFSLGYGVVGGKLTSGFTEGQRAAQIGRRILNGEKPSAIPVVKQPESQYMFDYNAMQRWGVNLSDLPAGSRVINRPFSFYETYKALIWGVGASFVILLAIAAFMFNNNLQRQRAEIRLSESNRELRTIQLSLEKRVQERTAELAQRAVQLQAAAQVARATTSVLDPDELLRQVADLVRERFDLYYVGLFLLDEAQRQAVLRAGTGEAGRQMMAQGHKLAVGGDSMIGQCVVRNEARIALDVGQDAVRFNNPLLPNTRSELALPLRARGQVLGAMTVQSYRAAAFDESSIAVLQTMADQVAAALDNARLFAQAQAALREIEATQRGLLARQWSDYVRRRAATGYTLTDAGMTPLSGAERPSAGGSAPELTAPIVLRGQPIGALGFTGERPWTDEETLLAQAIGEQFALAAENLRLLEETQRRAAREQLAGEITAHMRASLDLERVLQTAAQEIGAKLGLHDIAIRLGTQERG
jgi:GAF domain-containing protein